MDYQISKLGSRKTTWFRNFEYVVEVDNPKLFQDLNRDSINGLINLSIRNQVLDYDVAKVLHALFDGLYKHVGGNKGGSWYEYSEDDHRWNL